MADSIYWRRSMSAGHPSRMVCWLVVPSIIDLQMPDDFTLGYELTELGAQRFPTRVYMSFDREAVQAQAIEMYRRGRIIGFHTQWYDPEGRPVNKTKHLAKMRNPDSPRYADVTKRPIRQQLIVHDGITLEEYRERARLTAMRRAAK